MAFRAGPALVVVASLAVLAAAGGAGAQERCSGTLCDFYYGSSAPAASSAATPSTSPQPLTVPANPLRNWFGGSSSDTQQAAAPSGQQPSGASSSPLDNGFFHMGGGGVVSHNSASECGGTICDLFHGHSSSGDAAPSTVQSINGIPASRFDTPAAEPTVSVTSARVAAPEEEPHSYVAPLPKTAPACVHGGDPWSCYRR